MSLFTYQDAIRQTKLVCIKCYRAQYAAENSDKLQASIAILHQMLKSLGGNQDLASARKRLKAIKPADNYEAYILGLKLILEILVRLDCASFKKFVISDALLQLREALQQVKNPRIAEKTVRDLLFFYEAQKQDYAKKQKWLDLFLLNPNQDIEDIFNV